MCIVNFLIYGVQETYGNMLTTFAVLGPLNMSKVNGVYLATAFWVSMCAGFLNGELDLLVLFHIE